ncbi:hypothetical protein GAYE_SCF08G3058 [Galdieria yellowstonensis]|uniref:Proteasome assembly chaperone 3 n=1 Tax=Galdieria yellowstonensis TaxID=3028027 RepID=A0AAV9ICR4_9RHOD|nr:hypothetical protein GAYE_SCF08G3058 [Galdieria yellowstonensis]
MSSDAYRGRYVRHFNTICGTCHTDFVFERFEDRILLVISQLQGLGSIFSVTFDSSENTIFDVVPLLGKRDDENLIVFARTIGELLHSLGHQRPLVLCLALKGTEKEVLDAIVEALKNDVVPPYSH